MNKTQHEITDSFTIDHAVRTLEILAKNASDKMKQAREANDATKAWKMQVCGCAIAIAFKAAEAAAIVINSIDDEK